jgi:tetratricopeptide (TPR) repeat protein
VRERLAALLLVVALASGLAFQIGRMRARLGASQLLRLVEGRTVHAVSRGDSAELVRNLRMLKRAQELDPSEIGVLVARGSQYLLRGRHAAAIKTYEEALSLEPRPEIYLNMGRALLMSGEGEDADESFALAFRIHPLMRWQVPKAIRERVAKR